MTLFHLKSIGPFLLALSAVSLLSGCPAETCLFNDSEYSFGESFTAPDGCNECLCGENGAISCTEVACNGEPESPFDGGEPDGAVDGGADAGGEPSPTIDAGEPDSTTDSGSGPDGGAFDGGAFDGGAFDGGADAGLPDGGTLDAGVSDAGPEPLRDCVQIGQFNSNLGQCVCGTESLRPIDEAAPNDFECAFGQCIDNCCTPGEMIDPNDVSRCVSKGPPFLQHFAMAPIDDHFEYRGYAAGADSCSISLSFANEPPTTLEFDTQPDYHNAYPGTGQAFRIPINRNRFLFGGTMEAQCTGEFGSVGQTLVIPPADERFSLELAPSEGQVSFCMDTSFFPAYTNCQAYVSETLGEGVDGCFIGDASCRASALIPVPDTNCFAADSINSQPIDGDIVSWWCFVSSEQNDILVDRLSVVFNFDAATGGLTLNNELTGAITTDD